MKIDLTVASTAIASLLLVPTFFLVRVAIGGTEEESSVCGTPTDPCMNEENHRACMALLDGGCDDEDILVMESCPLQFACSAASSSEPPALSNYDHCVTLNVYKDSSCSDPTPLREMSFIAMGQTGSPCYSDASMSYYSVSDQYCSNDGTSFHQTVYLGSQECNVPWYFSFFSPQEQVFTKDTCLYGYKLKSCVKGPCDDGGGGLSSDNTEASDGAESEESGA